MSFCRVLGLLLVVGGTLIAVATIASLVWSSVLFVEARLLILGAAGSLVSLGVLLLVLSRGKRVKEGESTRDLPPKS